MLISLWFVKSFYSILGSRRKLQVNLFKLFIVSIKTQLNFKNLKTKLQKLERDSLGFATHYQTKMKTERNQGTFRY